MAGVAGSQFRRTGLDVGVGLGSRGSPFHGVQILAVPRRELFQREHEDARAPDLSRPHCRQRDTCWRLTGSCSLLYLTFSLFKSNI